MGCVSSSTQKKKKYEQKSSSSKESASQDRNTAETVTHDGKKQAAASHDQGFKGGTEPHINTPCLKESTTVASENLKATLKQSNGVCELQSHRNCLTNQETQGTANRASDTNQKVIIGDLEQILDEDLLKELEGDQDIVLAERFQKIEADSIAVDFEELKRRSHRLPSHVRSNQYRNDEEKKVDMSLTLNLTDLKIEQH